MALFADAVASGGLELRGINNIAGAWVGQMFGCGPVATLASNRFLRGRKYRGAIFVQRSGDMECVPRMAEDAFFADGPREIRIRLIFETWREIVGLAAPVKPDRRLEKVAADVLQITAGVIPGADDPIDMIFALVTAVFPTLPVAGGR